MEIVEEIQELAKTTSDHEIFVSSEVHRERPEEGYFRDRHVMSILQDSDIVICALSESYVSSPFCMAEFGLCAGRGPLEVLYLDVSGNQNKEQGYPFTGVPVFSISDENWKH